MCGVAGFIGYEDISDFCDQANEIQKHRGPDSQDKWLGERVGFAHQRLSIIDLTDAGRQPFVKRNLIMVFNGEIYNYKELKKEYLSEADMHSATDTEVVLEMFAQMGAKCLSLLRGMFSFAIWNTDTKELFLARDHYGIKPLFYSLEEDKLAFASELKTLLGTVVTSPKVDLNVLVKAVSYTWIPGNDSIIEQVKQLPQGSFAFYSQVTGEFKVTQYYELKVSENTTNSSTISGLISDSVKAHLVSDVPVSAFLSGGLDSSLISKIAKDELGSLETYTIGRSDEDASIERMARDEDYAKTLAQLENFEHHEFSLGSDIMKYLPKMVYHLDEPIGDPAAILTYLMCYNAKRRGRKVILSGMGADEIFFGYRRHQAFMLAKQLNSLPKPLIYFIKRFVDILPVKTGNRGLRLTRWSKKFLSFVGQSDSESYRMSYSYYNDNELKDLFIPDIESCLDQIKNSHEALFNKVDSSIQNKICYTDIHNFMKGLNLTYTDRSSMAASVEVRVPFIDKYVIENGMAINGEQKFKGKTLKYILKKSAENLLPKEIIYRPKSSFGAPIRSWISKDLVGLIDTVLSEQAILKRGMFNPSKVRQMIEDDRHGKSDFAYQIYQLLTIEIWFRIFIDKQVEFLSQIELTPNNNK